MRCILKLCDGPASDGAYVDADGDALEVVDGKATWCKGGLGGMAAAPPIRRLATTANGRANLSGFFVCGDGREFDLDNQGRARYRRPCLADGIYTDFDALFTVKDGVAKNSRGVIFDLTAAKANRSTLIGRLVDK